MGKIHRKTETDLGGGRGHRDKVRDAERDRDKVWQRQSRKETD
jgi:hypothetical protein